MFCLSWVTFRLRLIRCSLAGHLQTRSNVELLPCSTALVVPTRHNHLLHYQLSTELSIGFSSFRLTYRHKGKLNQITPSVKVIVYHSRQSQQESLSISIDKVDREYSSSLLSSLISSIRPTFLTNNQYDKLQPVAVTQHSH